MVNKKIILPLIAALLVVAGVFAMNAKNLAPLKRDSVTFHYKISSSNLADVRNVDNWEIVNTSPDCNPGSALPCTKVFEGDESDFQDYLNTFSSVAAITADATTKKSN